MDMKEKIIFGSLFAFIAIVIVFLIVYCNDPAPLTQWESQWVANPANPASPLHYLLFN